jgi:hypothetical protein
LFASACATPLAPPVDHEQRIEQSTTQLAYDPIVQAHRAAVEAAQANEERPKLVDRVELRAGEDYLGSEHQLRALARVKFRRPAELRAERNVLRAQTDIELARLEQAKLLRRVELCFPSVDVLVRVQQSKIFTDYTLRQKILLAWNEDWRASGVVDELSGARFELDSRVKLATRQPPPIAENPRISTQLPDIGAGAGKLVRSLEHLRETVRWHHPSVAFHRATEERYRRLAERSRARRLPGLRFVDVSYDHRTDSSRNGVGAQVAFEIPFGGESRAEIARFDALIRKQRFEGSALVEDQVTLSLRALDDVRDFESRSDQWRELEQLAAAAEQVADRWWKTRLARPAQVAALLDEAYAARIAVLEARERAANAECTLLAMTGVALEDWPRESLRPGD